MSASSGERPETSLDDPSGRIVLVVDDDESALEFVARTVEREGFGVERESNGSAVLYQIKTRRPDLIVLDLMLPGRSGYEILRELQEYGFGDIPVIVITARMVDAKTVEMIRQEPNVRDFLQKPLAPESFGMALRAPLKTRPAPPPAAAT